MKQLQNNFTTPEQSKRLLELGVPAESADCYYSGTIKHIVVIDAEVDKKEFFRGDIVPCWSVGRLMNLFDMCNTHEVTALWWDYDGDFDYIKYIMDAFSWTIEKGKMDFSILEE